MRYTCSSCHVSFDDHQLVPTAEPVICPECGVPILQAMAAGDFDEVTPVRGESGSRKDENSMGFEPVGEQGAGWFVVQASGRQGPYEAAELLSEYDAGRIDEDTLISGPQQIVAVPLRDILFNLRDAALISRQPQVELPLDAGFSPSKMPVDSPQAPPLSAVSGVPPTASESPPGLGAATGGGERATFSHSPRTILLGIEEASYTNKLGSLRWPIIVLLAAMVALAGYLYLV